LDSLKGDPENGKENTQLEEIEFHLLVKVYTVLKKGMRIGGRERKC